MSWELTASEFQTPELQIHLSMRIVGLQEDMVELVDIWLSTRYYYVTIEQVNSNIRMSKDGTIRGLI